MGRSGQFLFFYFLLGLLFDLPFGLAPRLARYFIFFFCKLFPMGRADHAPIQLFDVVGQIFHGSSYLLLYAINYLTVYSFIKRLITDLTEIKDFHFFLVHLK